MKLILDRAELRKKVMLNCNILETKDIISNSLSSIICFIFHKNQINLLSANNGITVKTVIEIDANIEEKIKFTVNGVSIKNVLNSFTCKEISFDIKENKIVFTNGKQRYNLSYRTDVYFPEIETGDKENAKEVDNDFFRYILDKTLFCLSKTNENPILSYVWFGEKVILAGDNCRFTKIKNSIKEISDIAVHHSVLSEIEKVLDSNQNLYYYTDGSVIYFIIEDFYYISCNYPEKEYPQFISESISSHDKSIVLETKALIDGVKFISNTINDANHKLYLELKDDSLIIFTETDIFDGSNEVPVIQQNNTEFLSLKVCVNYKYLLEILNKAKNSERVMIEYRESHEPINIRVKGEPFIHSIATIAELSKKDREEKKDK